MNKAASFRLLTSLFFMWGFITVMNDILINTFKGIFDLTPVQRSLVQFSFFGAFFVISLLYYLISAFSGKDPINRIGYKNGMSISLGVCGLGCIGFFAAAYINTYTPFLLALFILASGVTLLQICANPYATILSDGTSASSRLNLAQGLNSLGTTLGPIVGTILIYQVFSSGELTAFSVSKTYLVYGLLFLILAMLVKFSGMPTFVNTEKLASGHAVFRYRHLSLGILAIFFYVGSEVAVGSWIVEYLKDETIVGMTEERASYFLSYFWGGLMIGRLMASFSLNNSLSLKKKYVSMLFTAALVFALIYGVTGIHFVDQKLVFKTTAFHEIAPYLILLTLCFLAFVLSNGKAARSLVIFSTMNLLLLIVACTSTGQLAFISIISTGLFFSIGWSNIFTMAIKDLGKYTSQGSSLLVMAIVGGALLPMIQSFIIQKADVQTSFIIPMLGMVYLIFYGSWGHRIKKLPDE